MPVNRSLVSPTANPALEQALRDKLARRSEITGKQGELEPLAVRLGLIQSTLKPRFRYPQLMVLAADHGLAVDQVAPRQATTLQTVDNLLALRLPLGVFARLQGLEWSVVDCGMAEAVPPRERLMARKIAHGTRNARITGAMSAEQAHAAIRAGMEIADALPGNVLALAGVGVGGHESAALVISRLSTANLRDLLIAGPSTLADELAHRLVLLQGAQGRHREVSDPIEVLATFGGFEVAVMVGMMLVAASKRQLVIVDGVPACAALMVASRIAPAVVDYCVHSRSNNHQGLDHVLSLFNASALLELGMDSVDGTGATLAWPLVRSAAALLTDVVEGADTGPSQPTPLDAMVDPTLEPANRP